jgi:2'-5' RNA ligase
MRLFVGIALAPAVIGELSAIVAKFRRREDGLRWTAPESWHITLEFLGEVNPEQHRCLTEQLGQIHAAPVPVRLGELGFFDRSGVFLANVQLTPGLTALQNEVTSATQPCGFVPESRPFHPHITLARTKGQLRGSGLDGLRSKVQRQPVFTPFIAEEFRLYESFLGPGGSQYQVRCSVPLIAR